MRMLHEIVKAEIAAFYPAQPRMSLDGSFSVNLGAIQSDAVRRKAAATGRLAEDKALVELAFVFVNNVVAVSRMGLAVPQTQDAYTQALVEAVTIWERANEKFASQFRDAGALARVLVESPYEGDRERNMEYARECMRDCMGRGEVPFAAHLLFTQVTEDSVPEERGRGIEMGLVWGSAAAKTAVYTDLGISEGMKAGIQRATQEGRPVEYRKLKP